MRFKNSVIIFGSTCAIIFVFLLLFQQYIIVIILRTHPDPLSTAVRAYAWYMAGLLFSGFFSPWLLRFINSQPSDDSLAKQRSAAFWGVNAVIVLLALLSVVHSDQFAGIISIARPQIASFTLGALLPIALMLFFWAVPANWHGRSFGALCAFMELLRLILLLDLAGALHFHAPPPPEHLDFFLQTMRRVLLVLLAAVACVNLALWRFGIGFSSIVPQTPGAPGQAAQLPAYRKAIGPYTLMALTGLCFIMSGLVGSVESLAFMYFKPSPLGLNVAFCLAALLTGICIDIYGQRAVWALVTTCACIFLFIPLLVAIDAESTLYSIIYYVAYTAQHIFALVVLVVLGRAPHEGRFPGLMCAALPALRGGAFFIALALQNAGPLYTEAILIGSLVLAASILVAALRSSAWRQAVNKSETEAAPMTPEDFASHYRLSPRDKEVLQLLLKGADAPAIATVLGIAPARPPGEVVSPQAFAERYQLTPRMREVLHLLLEGASTKDISTSLGISQYTARLHVHHILRKAKLHSRKSIREMVANMDEGGCAP